MRSLVLIGSPYFDGIGILQTESKKMLNSGSVMFLDAILLGAYPEIKNFDTPSFMLWRLVRLSQFRKSLPPHEYVYLKDILAKYQDSSQIDLQRIVETCIKDHSVCNSFSDEKAENYRLKNKKRFEKFFSDAYLSLKKFIKEMGFDEIVVFNGRNSVARILISAANEIGIKIRWLESFGKKEGGMSYISTRFDIFDLDRFSDELLYFYNSSNDVNKHQVAIDCIKDRIQSGDPLLIDWGVNLKSSLESIKKKDKKISTFFFSSEDEYPAFSPSKYGLSPPNNQFKIFKDICDALVESDLHKTWVICIKLHPRYVAFSEKLKIAREHWELSIEYANQIGIDLRVIDPLRSAYTVINESDLVFSFGTTAWEATCMGKPAVLLGPNIFSTHKCCYVANNICEIVEFIKNPPPPLHIEDCYPYAWALRKFGSFYPNYSNKLQGGLLKKIASQIHNRFK